MDFNRICDSIYERYFDLYYNVKTGRRIEVNQLNIPDELREHAYRYEPTPYHLLHAVFRCLSKLNLQEILFIDYGSGAGRVLRVAKKFGFKQLIGIELDPNLVQLTMENMDLNKNVADTQALIFQQNAEQSLLLHQPAVHFLFNPFGWPILKKVLENILSYGGEQYIVYVNPAFQENVQEMGFTAVETMTVSGCNYKAIIFKSAF